MSDSIHIQGTPLQDAWPNATCYGCGPANPKGLHIKSYWLADGSAVVAEFHPRPEYNAGFDNVIYGGLVASLIDCHSVWTAIAYAYRAEGRPHGEPPAISYVTGTLEVKFLKPTPLDQPLLLSATLEEMHGKKSIVRCMLGPAGTVTAEGRVTAIRISGDKSVGAG